jgi:hypothetical protein
VKCVDLWREAVIRQGLLPNETVGLDRWHVILECGREYLWRGSEDPENPELKMWTEGRLESGERFWYDGDGEIILTDPFARWRKTGPDDASENPE